MLKEAPKIKIAITILACTTGLLFFFLLNTLCDFEKDKYLFDEHKAASDYGELLRSEVDRELNSLLFVSNGLSSYLTVYKDELNGTKINEMLEVLWRSTQHVKNLGIAIGYEMAYAYPIIGNEKIIGTDFRKLPRQWEKVKLAIDTREGVLDGPLNLIQGGRGIVYRYPIFIDSKYWGILSTVINTDSFMESAFKRVANNKFTFAIRSENKNVFYGNPKLFNHKGAVLIKSNLPNSEWEWAIEKRDLKLPTYFLVLDALAVILSVFVGLAIYYYGRERYRLTNYSLRDSLTNLPNRRYLDKKLLEVSVETNRVQQMLGIMLIDVDYFKQINDTHGHDFGDEVLKRVAELIQLKIRNIDTLSRMGGDEFVILIQNLKSENDIKLIASKIIDSFQVEQFILGKSIQLSLSIGVTVNLPNEKIDIKELMRQADDALYAAKAEGRNRFKLFSNM